MADLHPQLADLMLDALAEEGVAAYASASPGPSNRGLTIPTQLPAGPVDRLWVDRDATATARRILDDKLPALRAELESATAETVTGHADSARDLDHTPGGVLVDDDTWAGIIASYRGDSAARPGSAPTEPVDPDAKPMRRSSDARPVDDVNWPEQVALEAVAARAKPVEDPEDTYHPPPPPPLPLADNTTRAAWAGVIGGPLLFLLSIFLGWNLSGWVQLAGVAALVGGFVTLVTRMRDGEDEDDGDNGAVV